MFDRYARSWPKHERGEPATYGAFSEACETRFEWDSHFAAYSAPSVPRRLGEDAALSVSPAMVMFVVDVDGPDHKATDEWWAGEREKVRALFKARGRGYAYRTKGGYRICYGLESFPLRAPADKRRWSASYLDWLEVLRAEHGIAGDPACKDAFRCYRLPRVRRDDVDVEPLEEVGTSSGLAPWRAPLCAADDPRVVRPPAESVPSAAAPVDPEKLQEAAWALIPAWPKQGRHAASLALCGALARLGWEDEAIADFVDGVCQLAADQPGAPALGPEATYEKRLAQARSSAEKVARGEEVAGWGSLELAGVDPDALLAARRALGCGPDRELFELALSKVRAAGSATDPIAVRDVLRASVAAKLAQAINAPAASAPPDPVLRLLVQAEALAVDGLVVNPNFEDMLDKVADKLPGMIEQAESKAAVVDPTPMFATFRELEARRTPAPRFLIQGMIPEVGVGALAGEPKSAKSWDATYYAVCLAAGVSVLNKFAVQRAERVAYFYSEDTEAAVVVRVCAIAKSLGLDPNGAWKDNLLMQPRGRALDVMNTAQLCVLAASVERHGKFGLLILDPLSNIHSGEEDKRDSMVKVMARLHALESYLGCAVLFVHHSAKTSADNKNRSPGQSMRGSSAIHGAVDFGIYLTNLRGDGETEFVAQVYCQTKVGRSAGRFDRHLKIVDDDAGNAITATFEHKPPDAGEGPKDLAEETAVDIVHLLFKQGGPLTTREIHTKLGGNKNQNSAGGKIAADNGWIRPRYHGAGREGFEITEAGMELVRTGRKGKKFGGSSGEEPDPSSPSSPPASPPAGSMAAAVAGFAKA